MVKNDHRLDAIEREIASSLIHSASAVSPVTGNLRWNLLRPVVIGIVVPKIDLAKNVLPLHGVNAHGKVELGNERVRSRTAENLGVTWSRR